jgi:hypothetical protein
MPEVEAGHIEAESQSRDPDFAETVLNLFEDLPDGVTSALGGDHNT